MKKARSRTLPSALISALALGAFALPSVALAQSTTMYPANDSVSLSSTPITIPIGSYVRGSQIYTGSTTCTLNGGAFTVPASGKSGPVIVNFTTRPTYTGCTEIEHVNNKTKVPVTITTSGAWTLSAQYGTAAVVVAAPVLTINIAGEPALTAGSGISFGGGWDNGFSSPVSVASAVQWGGTVTMSLYEQGEKTKEVAFPLSLETMTDTTHPASLPVLGP